MASLDDLVLPLRAHATGASLGLLKQAYLEAARKFFHESTAWRDEIGSITVGSSNAAYTLAPTQTDAEVFDATRVWHKDNRLVKKSRTQIQTRYSKGNSPAVFRIGAPNSLHIAPGPDEDVSSDLVVHGALRPTRTADVLDDEAADRFDEALLNGARWKILLMPQPWRDVSMAEYYRKLFQDSLDREHALAADDGQVGVDRTMRYGGY